MPPNEREELAELAERYRRFSVEEALKAGAFARIAASDDLARIVLRVQRGEDHARSLLGLLMPQVEDAFTQAWQQDGFKEESAAYAAWSTWTYTSSLVALSDPGNLHYRAVYYALEAEEGDELAKAAGEDGRLRDIFARELMRHARAVVAEVLTGDVPLSHEAACEAVDTEAGPALRWDARFADYLEAVGGDRGAELAGHVRARAAERMAAHRSEAPPPPGALWVLWLWKLTRSEEGKSQPRWLLMLAMTLWPMVRRQVEEERERERLASRPVTLPVASLRMLSDVLTARDVKPADGGRSVLVDSRGAAVAAFQPRPRLATAVAADALEALARAGVGDLATVAAMRFVPWFAHAVQRREDERDPLVIAGTDGMNAYAVLAAAMGMRATADAAAVRGVLWALNATIVSYPDGGEAGVLLVDYRSGGGRGNPSRLELTPGRPWLWSDVYALPEGARHRALAPIPLLPNFAPPFVGDRRERAALGRLYLRILAELAHLAPDIARGRGAHIPGARWAELAREEGVQRPPPLLVGQVQDRWTRDGDDGPAILERVDNDRWHLAPAFEHERLCLEEGGRLRIGAAEGGKRSARKRRQAREQLAAGRLRKPKG